jgi:ABC-type lipoprotein release transport system permease subunit
VYASVEIALLWLRGHPSRLIHLVASLAIATCSWLVLSTIASTISERAAHGQSEAIVVMAERKGRPLPLGHITTMEALDGVADVAYMTFLPVMCREPSTIATLNAWHIPTDRLRAVLGENTPVDAIRSWQAADGNLLVGSRLARECGWTAGVTIEPINAFNGSRVRVTITSVLPPGLGGSGDQIAYAHYRYIDRMSPPQDGGTFRVARVYPRKGVSAAALAATVETALAHGTEPVEATPSAEAESLMARFESVGALLWGVAAAMGTSTLLLFASAFAHAAAKRRASIAVLLALGFRHRQIRYGSSLEIAAVVVAGTAVGAAAGYALLHAIAPLTSLHLGGTRITAGPCIAIAAGGGVLWLLSALAPLLAVGGVQPTDMNAA